MFNMPNGDSVSSDNPEIVAQIKAMTDEASTKTAQTTFDKFIDNLTQTVQDFAKVNNTSFEEIAANVEKYADRIHNAYERAYGDWNNKTTTGGVPVTQAQVISQVATSQISSIPTQDIQKVADATKEASVQTVNWSNGIKQVAMGLGIYVSIASGIRAIVSILKEAIQLSITFNQNLFTLQVGIRAMQRSGLDITFQGMSDSIEKIRTEFKVFSTQDIVQGYSTAIVKMRQLGASQQQINNLMEESGKLAILSGQTIADVSQDISYAITTGYSRTLKNLGIAFSRQMLDAEAAAMGIKGTYNALDNSTKLLVAQSLIDRQLAGYANDISDFYKTQPGKIEMANAQLTESKTLLGDTILPLWADVVKYIANSVDGLFHVRDTMKQIWDNAQTGVLGKVLLEAVNYMASLVGLGGQFRDILKDLGVIKIPALTISGINANATEKAFSGLSDSEIEQVITAFDALKTDYETAYEDMEKKILDISQKTNQDLLNAQEQYNQKSLDLQTKYAQTLEDLATKNDRNNTDAYTTYQNDLISIQVDYQNSVVDLQEKYAQDEVNIETDLQRKLSELRDKAFLDLDGAIQNRDARQALSIIRQYNFDRDQAIKTAANASQDRQTQFQQELADLKRQNEIKVQQRQVEYQQKLAEIALEYQREQADALLAHQRDMADNDKWLTDERESIKKNQQDEIKDAQDALQQKLKDLGEAYATEYGMNEKLINSLEILWNEYYTNTETNIASLYSFAQDLQDYINGVNLPPIGGNGSGSGGGGGGTIHYVPFAQGGTFIAKKPMLAMFGEGGVPEKVTVTPANKSGYNSGQGGNLQIELLLSPDLQARIINNTLKEVADIFVQVQRRQ